MMIKKEDHSKGLSDIIKKFFNGKTYQEFFKKESKRN